MNCEKGLSSLIFEEILIEKVTVTRFNAQTEMESVLLLGHQ